MKIRNGFVSNSSSSSFLIYGASVSSGDLTEEAIEKIMEISEEKDFGYTKENLEEISSYELSEALECTVLKDFECHTMSYQDECYVGISPESQDDNITHGEWKQNIKDRINKALPGTDLSFGWYEDCSYDG